MHKVWYKYCTHGIVADMVKRFVFHETADKNKHAVRRGKDYVCDYTLIFHTLTKDNFDHHKWLTLA